MSEPSPSPLDPADVEALEVTVLERTSGRHDARIDDETVIFDSSSGQVSSINPTGTLLWELLAEPVSVAELGRALITRYGIDEQRAFADVCAYVDGLRSRGLVRLRGD